MQPTRRGFLGGLVGLWSSRLFARPSARIDDLVAMIARSTQKSILENGARAMARGATPAELLQAAFLAPILTGGDGEDVHAMLVIPSIRQLGGSVPVFWALANAQLWCKPDGHAEISGGFEEASLRLEASRPRPDPHAAIFAAQATRMLPGLPARYHAAVRSSVGRYLERAGPATADPKALRLNESDRTPASEIAVELGRAPNTSLEGFSSRAIWEALARIAIETRIADGTPSGPGVHVTTLLDAEWLICERARPEDRPLILARAVTAVLGLRKASTAEPPKFQAALVEVARDREKFFARLRAEVVQKGTGEHDFKYFAAVENVASRLDGSIRDRWLAASVLAHPVGVSDRWHRADEVRALLR